LDAAKTVILRRPLFYLGNVLALVGLLLFLSTFLTAALNFGNFDHFDDIKLPTKFPVYSSAGPD
jgi:hypothetical protein